MDRDKYPTIFHIDIDAFFTSVEEALCPTLRGKPVIVGGLPNERGVVACPNYEARRLGVKTAMPLSQAYRLAPNAVFMRGHYKNYERFSRRFIEILHDFSPAVEAVSLDEAFLDANGCLHFWDYDPRNLATSIKRAVWEELKITVSIGVASNKLCAKVASDYSKKWGLKATKNKAYGEETPKGSAELYSESLHTLGSGASWHSPGAKESQPSAAPPNGLFIVPLGEERNFLAPFPVSALPGIGRKTNEVLESLGIKTVGELANANKNLLNKIFGVVGDYLHDAANGVGSCEISNNERDAKSISRSTTFSEDTKDEDFIYSVIFYLSEKIARALRRENLAASTVIIRMRYSDGLPLNGHGTKRPYPNRRFVTYQKNYTLQEPTNSELEIASVASELFKKLWLEGLKVRLIGVGVTNIMEERFQLDLFQQSKVKQINLLTGIDKLREKFGYHSIYFGIIDKMERRYESNPDSFKLHTLSE